MNIILYVKNLKGRGVQKVYLNLAKGLMKNRHNVYFVIRENIIEFDIDFLSKLYLFDTNTTYKIDNLLKTLKNPIIISNDVKVTLSLKNISYNRIYYTVNMLWGERIIKNFRLKRWFELKKLYKNKKIIVCSNAIKNDLLYKIRIKPKNINIINDGFDIENIRLLSKESTDFKKDFLLNIGSLSKEKNQFLLLKVFANLKTNNDLIILGEGKLENKLKNYAKKLKLENKVHFLGFKSNPYPYIKNAQLLISTSKNEGLPGVVIESLILKTPVVSMDSIGVRDILTGKFLKFITNNKPNILVKKINEALKYYPPIENTDTQKYSYVKIADDYINYIKKDLNETN